MGQTVNRMSEAPLADRLRPKTLAEVVGQSHLVGPGKALTLMVEKNRLPSLLLWGPPGVGKTTLARLIAQETGRTFFELSAVSAGKDDMRRVVEAAKPSKIDLFNAPREDDKPPILFLDEIHRFNKAQQDFLLPHVEAGVVTLIGATTENPSFEVVPALLSRARVLTLKALNEEEMVLILKRGAGLLEIAVQEEALAFLARFSDGDARMALNSLEEAASLLPSPITLQALEEAFTSRALRFDKGGEEHYNTISAFIKSMRASDPDAALYYLARMLEGGQDPKFIARRMVIFASEDVGLASPTALRIALDVFRACEIIGLPECAINLSHGVCHLALSPKSRASCDALGPAMEDARKGAFGVPMKLRNAPTRLMKEMGYGKDTAKTDHLFPEEIGLRKYLDWSPPAKKKGEG